MSYLDYEKSESSGKPIEIYRFSMGETQWLFTNSSVPVYYLGDKYIPIFISRDGYTKSGEATKSSVNIKLSANNPIALLFRTGWITGALVVTVYRHHYNDIEYKVIWKGRITGCKWDNESTATLTSDNSYTLLKRSGLRRVYQVTCPHVLYDINSCMLVENNYKVSSSISYLLGNRVTVRNISSYGDGYFTGGKIKVGNDLMMVVNHVGSNLYLVDSLYNAVVDDAIDLYPGCDRVLSTCDTKFNNSINFGGFPFLPTKNPFSGDALV